MQNYKLLHDHPDHFLLTNGKAHFKIAKSGIDQPTADKIRSFADGGTIQTPYEAGIEAKEKNIRSTPTQSPDEAQIEAAEKNRRAQPAKDYIQENNPDLKDKENSLELAEGGKLDANARKHIASKNFAGPDRSYPIEDASHARNALARVSQHGSPELKAQVRAKVHSKYPGIEQSMDDGGTVDPTQSFQDSFRKATHYNGADSDSNPSTQIVGDPDVVESIKESARSPSNPQPTSTPNPDREERYAKIRANNAVQGHTSQYDNGPIESHANGGPVASNSVKDISHETQSQAIGRYAAGNPANLAQGGHIHHNAGKNQLHFHFYDGPVPHSDKQPEAPATPLDNYVNLADPSGTVAEEARNQGVDISAEDIPTEANPTPAGNFAAGQTPLQQEMAQTEAEENPTPQQSANNLAQTMGQPAPFGTDAEIPTTTVDPNRQISLKPKTATPPDTSNPGPAQPMNLSKTLQDLAVNPVQTTPPTDILTQSRKDYQLAEGAVAAGALGQADYYNKTAKALKDEADFKQKQFDEYQDTIATNNLKLNDLADNVAANKIDPNRYWTSKGTTGRILGSIGLILGGIGGGLNGTNKNVAMEQLNNHIMQDIEAQKADNSNNVTLYKIGLNKYHNDQAAFNFAMMNHAAMTAGQIQQFAAKSNNQQVQSQAVQAIMGLRQTAMQNSAQLAMHQMAMNMASGAAGTQGINPEMLPQEMRERTVNLPGGGLGLARSKETADLAQKEMTSYGNINGGINKAINLLQTNGRVYNPVGADKAVADSARTDIITELNHLHDINRLNEYEWKAYSSQVPSPGDWMQGKALSKLQALQDNVNRKMEATKANYLEGYRPPPTITKSSPKIGGR